MTNLKDCNKSVRYATDLVLNFTKIRCTFTLETQRERKHI